MLLVTQLIAFWFYLLMADERVLYRPRWLAESQRAACVGQANSKQTAGDGSQSINNGISLPSINNGLLHPRHYPRYDPEYLTASTSHHPWQHGSTPIFPLSYHQSQELFWTQGEAFVSHFAFPPRTRALAESSRKEPVSSEIGTSNLFITVA